MSVLDHLRHIFHGEPEPAPKVTERSVRDQLYGGRRTIDVAPRNPIGDWLDRHDLTRELPPARGEDVLLGGGSCYDQGADDENAMEPRDPDEHTSL